jgi:hypothetical protein
MVTRSTVKLNIDEDSAFSKLEMLSIANVDLLNLASCFGSSRTILRLGSRSAGSASLAIRLRRMNIAEAV